MIDNTTVPALDLFEHYFCNPTEVAEWVIDQRLKIVGILDDPSKINPKKLFFSELEKAKSQALCQRITSELQLLLRSRSKMLEKINEGSGTTFDLIDQLPEIEENIRSVLNMVIFDRDNFDELFLADNKTDDEDQGLKDSVSPSRMPKQKHTEELFNAINESEAKPSSTDCRYRIIAAVIEKELNEYRQDHKKASAADELEAVKNSGEVKSAIRKNLGVIEFESVQKGLRDRGLNILPKPRGGRPRGKKAAPNTPA